MTQFGHALTELNIEIFCANSSQAKGRVARANRTLQDRLVKELRLRGIPDIDAGNEFLPASWNDSMRSLLYTLPSPRTYTVHPTLLPVDCMILR